jgi:hypothetical protein
VLIALELGVSVTSRKPLEAFGLRVSFLKRNVENTNGLSREKLSAS